jgi:hypothetical protein
MSILRAAQKQNVDGAVNITEMDISQKWMHAIHSLIYVLSCWSKYNDIEHVHLYYYQNTFNDCGMNLLEI